MAVGTYEYKSDFMRQAFAEGEANGSAKGEAKAVLRFLEARGIPVPEAERQRIITCTDPDLLNDWTWRAATVSSIEELFGDDS